MGKRRSSKPCSLAKFRVGDKVRVKRGVRDVDYPDMPIGGWAGTVKEVRSADTVVVRWSNETLTAVHPVVKQRCEIDGLDPEVYQLAADDLEADPGGPLAIEHPTTITTRPLSPKDQDDRLRMIFGLTSNDILPDVDDESLQVYGAYLSQNLAFPFEADIGAEYRRPEKARVVGLPDPGKEPLVNKEFGILCKARLEGESVMVPLGELRNVKGASNRRLVDDYCYWYHNWI